MQSILNLRSFSYGFPLCLSGITHPLSLSKQNIADHDRRREEMKKKRKMERPREREVLSTDHEEVRVGGNYEIVLGGIHGDLVDLRFDDRDGDGDEDQLLKRLLLPCTAKAA